MPSKVEDMVRTLRKDNPASMIEKGILYLARQTSHGDRLLYEASLKEIRERMEVENDLDDILDTVLDFEPGYPPYQIWTYQLRDEIKELAELLNENQPETALEIGTMAGGTFYIWNRYLKSIDKSISLDWPGGRFGGGYNKQKTGIFREFSSSNEMHFVRENSHKDETCRKVSKLVEDQVDFLFIDGDHTYEGVKQDFEMYSQLVSEGGIIALHDIVNHPDDREVVTRRRGEVDDIEKRHLSWSRDHADCNVDKFWAELVSEYDTRELVSHPKQTWAGIGVVRL